MSRRPVNNWKRFLGNSNRKQVHDLDNEQQNCQIDEIARDHVVSFTPDTLAQAKSQGYDPCAYCIGD